MGSEGNGLARILRITGEGEATVNVGGSARESNSGVQENPSIKWLYQELNGSYRYSVTIRSKGCWSVLANAFMDICSRYAVTTEPEKNKGDFIDGKSGEGFKNFLCIFYSDISPDNLEEALERDWNVGNVSVVRGRR